MFLARPSPPPPPPLYDPEEDNAQSHVAIHSQDLIGEHEDMELDDTDQPETTNVDEITAPVTFVEQPVEVEPEPPTSIPTSAIPSLYDEDNEVTNIPTESHPVS
jgi:hypothetical protein